MGLKLSDKEQKRIQALHDKFELKAKKDKAKKDWAADWTIWRTNGRIRYKEHRLLEKCVCGNKPEIAREDKEDNHIESYVVCSKCKLETQRHTDNNSTARLIGNWNVMMGDIETERLANKFW